MSSLEGGQGTDHWLTEEGQLQLEQLGKNWEAGAWTRGPEDWFDWLETEQVAKVGKHGASEWDEALQVTGQLWASPAT